MTPYERIGGAPSVRALAQRFYAIMDELPVAQTVRAMHGPDLSSSAEKFYLFLSGWLGGPNLYVERYGAPFLRARHLPFSIGESERDAWLACMRQALEETVGEHELRVQLFDAFAGLANHMRNRAEAPSSAGATSPGGTIGSP